MNGMIVMLWHSVHANVRDNADEEIAAKLTVDLVTGGDLGELTKHINSSRARKTMTFLQKPDSLDKLLAASLMFRLVLQMMGHLFLTGANASRRHTVLEFCGPESAAWAAIDRIFDMLADMGHSFWFLAIGLTGFALSVAITKATFSLLTLTHLLRKH